MDSRFSRQIPVLGEDGQRRLSGAGAVIVGCGGLGSHVSGLLVRAGIGRLRIIDHDRVETSNLHRTALFREGDVNRNKAKAAVFVLGRINSSCRLEAVERRLGRGNSSDLLSGMDVIIDCTDNMDARFIINRFSVLKGRPWIYGSVEAEEGLVACLRGKPCLSCLYPSAPGESGDTPVVGYAASIVASLQARMAVGLVAGRKEHFGRLTRVKLQGNVLEEMRIPVREDCKICGHSL